MSRRRWDVAFHLGCCVCAPLLLIATPALAEMPRSDAGVTGDWGGLRTMLASDGLTFSGGYTSELAYNAGGGQKQETAEAGEIDLGLAADLQRMAGLPGGLFKATVTDRRGTNLADSAGLGVLQEVQEINGRGHSWRLTQFWYEQTLGAVRIKVGRNPPNEDFAAFSCEFQNLSFCSAAPGNIVTDTWFNWPIAEWSARLRIDVHEAYVQVGAYVDNPRDLDDGLTLGHIRGAKGVLYPFEIGWTPTFAGRAGSYKIGGWYSTADSPEPQGAPAASGDSASSIAPIALTHASHSGGWINLEQNLGLRSMRGGTGLSVFFNFTQADQRTSEIDQQLAAGLFYGGLLPGRPDDVIGLGLARTHLSSAFNEARIASGPPPGAKGAEYVAEIYYSFRPRPWVSFSPNLQVIEHPGGVASRRPVVVLGLKAGLKL
jgi:porin